MTDQSRKETSQHLPVSLRLKDAVRQIRQSYEWALRKDRPAPFFLVIGAGVSVPQVPLAAEIIRRCREVCGSAEAQPVGTAVSSEYSRWLNEAFHAPEMRQDFFRELIEGKPIPTAHLRLAHLLLGEGMKQPFTNLVVTTNFDNFLSRALNLFGKEHVLCDSPSTAPRLVLSNPDLLQIVHVHGSYQFYDIKNLSDELQGAAALSDETTATMSSLLESLLRDRSPIVVGYGGWDGDVFMFSLKRRLRGGGLPQPLYWCCYRRGDWQMLPDWLQRDPNIRFIEPDPPQTASGAARSETANVSPALLQEAGMSGANELDAQVVFDEIIQSFSIPEPALTKNPVAFFARQMDQSLPKEEANGGTADPYRIKSAIDEMRAAAKWVEEYRLQRSVAEQGLQRVRERLREANYSDAIAAILNIELEDLTQTECDELLEIALEIVESATFSRTYSEQSLEMLRWIERLLPSVTPRTDTTRRAAVAQRMAPMALVALGRGKEAGEAIRHYVETALRSDDSEIWLSALQLLIGLASVLLESDPATADKYLHFAVASFGHLKEEKLQPALGAAYAVRAILLDTLKNYEQSLEASETFLSDFAHLPTVVTFVPRVIVSKSGALGELGRHSEALAVADEMISRFGASSDQAIRDQLARVFVRKAVLQVHFNRQTEALNTYDELEKRFGESAELYIREQVARGIVNKGILLGELGRTDDAISAFDSVVLRVADAPEPGLREQIARALVNKGIVLARLQKHDEAIEAHWEVERRFGNATESSLRIQVAFAFVLRAGIPEDLGRVADAITVYEDFERRFGDATEPAIREQVAVALLSMGALKGRQGDTSGEIAVYERLVQRFGETAADSGMHDYVGNALNRIGYHLLCRAKAEWRKDDASQFLARLKEAENKIDESLKYRPGEPITLGNKGYLRFLQGRTDEASQVLTEAIRLGGEDLRNAELADADINPIPLDESFKTLVRGIVVDSKANVSGTH